MGDNSQIQWTDATWPVTVGCTKVSPGCDNCYAIRDARRLSGNPNAIISAVYSGLVEFEPGTGLEWTGAVRCLPERLDWPARWQRPRRIFVCSQSDLFHQDVPDAFIDSVFTVMAMLPRHTFQVLTKRPDRMRRLLATVLPGVREAQETMRPAITWPLANVWLGTSVESQAYAWRIQKLVETPAAVRFLSCEPLLGPLDLTPWLSLVHWVIAGGESGPESRPMHPDWARDIRDQCVKADVAFHFKQHGEYLHRSQVSTDLQGHLAMEEAFGGMFRYADAERTFIRLGKKRAGRELDGRTWDEFPLSPVATS